MSARGSIVATGLDLITAIGLGVRESSAVTILYLLPLAVFSQGQVRLDRDFDDGKM